MINGSKTDVCFNKKLYVQSFIIFVKRIRNFGEDEPYCSKPIDILCFSPYCRFGCLFLLYISVEERRQLQLHKEQREINRRGQSP